MSPSRAAIIMIIKITGLTIKIMEHMPGRQKAVSSEIGSKWDANPPSIGLEQLFREEATWINGSKL